MSSSAILLGLLVLMATFAIGFLIGRSSSSWAGASGRAVVWRVLKPTLVVFGLFLLAIQLIPYGRAHANPPVLAEPAWDSPTTRDLAVRACFDCHSNETAWPWYSNIAPVSWLVERDVDGGRNKANWSEWGRHPGDESSESAETVREGSMPPGAFTLIHSEARLTDQEMETLIAGLVTTFGSG
jgi:Haem-binding domain